MRLFFKSSVFPESFAQPLINLAALVPGLYLGYGIMFIVTGEAQYGRPHNTGIAIGMSCILLSVAWNIHSFFSEREKILQMEKSSLSLDLMQTKLKTLNLQMNPHFLFNALNMLVNYCGSEPKKAENIALDLSDLLRKVLKASEKEFHPLSSELEICHLYLALQKERFRNLSFKESVQDDILGHTVPPMILQPLLENALHYGADPLSLKIFGNSLVTKIRVENRIPAGRSERMTGAGMALVNIEKRLRLGYGDKARFCKTDQDGIFTVEMTLPQPGVSYANSDC